MSPGDWKGVVLGSCCSKHPACKANRANHFILTLLMLCIPATLGLEMPPNRSGLYGEYLIAGAGVCLV